MLDKGWGLSVAWDCTQILLHGPHLLKPARINLVSTIRISLHAFTKANRRGIAERFTEHQAPLFPVREPVSSMVRTGDRLRESFLLFRGCGGNAFSSSLRNPTVSASHACFIFFGISPLFPHHISAAWLWPLLPAAPPARPHNHKPGPGIFPAQASGSVQGIASHGR